MHVNTTGGGPFDRNGGSTVKVIVIPARLNFSSDNMAGGYLSERRRESWWLEGFYAAIIIADH